MRCFQELEKQVGGVGGVGVVHQQTPERLTYHLVYGVGSCNGSPAEGGVGGVGVVHQQTPGQRESTCARPLAGRLTCSYQMPHSPPYPGGYLAKSPNSPKSPGAHLTGKVTCSWLLGLVGLDAKEHIAVHTHTERRLGKSQDVLEKVKNTFWKKSRRLGKSQDVLEKVKNTFWKKSRRLGKSQDVLEKSRHE
jgi:hypothetical protein